MQFPHQIVNTANLVVLATVAAVYEDVARAVVLVVFVVGIFVLTALHIEVPQQIWLLGGVVFGYFFKSVSSQLSQTPPAPKSKSNK